MAKPHPEDVWAKIKTAFTTTRKPLTVIAREHGVSYDTIAHRSNKEGWQRLAGGVITGPNAHNIVIAANARQESRGGVFSIAPVPGSLQVPFHTLETKGPDRQCAAIFDDRPGAMDTSIACGLRTESPERPYCAKHGERFGGAPSVNAKELTRSLRRFT